IVTVYDAGEDNGILYLAMEFIEGSTLEALIRQQRTIATAQTIDIIRQVCAGLDFAHGKGIIHRDVKPGNIMLASNGPVKITDFGIARAGEAMTITGQVVGTPNYMSPEQVLGKQLDGRSDLFSVGVILYEMVTGERPFEGQSITTIMYKIVHETPIPPRKLDATIHPGLSAVIEKALSKSADDRFPNGEALVRALQEYKTASLSNVNTLGQPTGDFPGLVDANATYDARPHPSQVPSQPVPGGPPAQQSRSTGFPTLPPEQIPERRRPWDLAPRWRRRAGILFVLAAFLIYSRFQRHSSKTHSDDKDNGAPASTVAAPPAPTPPTDNSEAQPGPQQVSPALVKHENATNSTTATMKLNSNPPAAEVELDGRPTGKRTPTELQIGRGRHRVSIRMPGFQTSSVTVKVAGGEEFEYSPDLTVAMPNIPSINMPDLSKLKELSKDQAFQEQFWQKWAGRQVGPGPKLVVNSKPPGASIFIEGKDSGQTSPAVIPLKPGKYHVKLVLEGFDAVESDVTVLQNQAAQLNPTLKPSGTDQ
ncbi:MAG TPA: serine/threonine-protein kinase, partial [Terriglobales bacterium]|nr:serine/threonine-protein kinase [Terriglobales bacterium]